MTTEERKSITEIKKMVEEWYEGSIDKNRDEVLFAYFSDSPDEDIPSELKDDAEIFRTLGERYQSCPDSELIAMIDNQIRKDKTKILGRRILRFSAVFSTAACIAALIFGLSYLKIDKIQETSAIREKQVTTKADHKTKSYGDTIKYVKSDDFSDKIAKTAVPKRKKTKISQLREVTDINEAIAILKNIDSNLDKTLAIGVETINEAENGINKTNETTKKLLNNLSI